MKDDVVWANPNRIPDNGRFVWITSRFIRILGKENLVCIFRLLNVVLRTFGQPYVIFKRSLMKFEVKTKRIGEDFSFHEEQVHWSRNFEALHRYFLLWLKSLCVWIFFHWSFEDSEQTNQFIYFPVIVTSSLEQVIRLNSRKKQPHSINDYFNKLIESSDKISSKFHSSHETIWDWWTDSICLYGIVSMTRW